MTRFLAILAGLPLLADEQPSEIIKRYIAASNRNWERASQYTWVQQADYFDIAKDGSAKKDRSQTFEVMFIDGGSYQKLVARNDQPLDAKQQAREEIKWQKIVEERRKQHSGVLHKNVSLGSDEDLLTLFDNRLEGMEEIRGRKSWVLLSAPLKDRTPANNHEKEVLSYERKLWIDQASNQLVRVVYTVVGDHTVFAKGSTITWDFDQINDEIWLMISGVINGRLQFAKIIKPAVRTEYHNSKFQKFDVQSTIAVDPPK
jgi:hypothetical protein